MGMSLEQKACTVFKIYKAFSRDKSLGWWYSGRYSISQLQYSCRLLLVPQFLLKSRIKWHTHFFSPKNWWWTNEESKFPSTLWVHFEISWRLILGIYFTEVQLNEFVRFQQLRIVETPQTHPSDFSESTIRESHGVRAWPNVAHHSFQPFFPHCMVRRR